MAHPFRVTGGLDVGSGASSYATESERSNSTCRGGLGSGGGGKGVWQWGLGLTKELTKEKLKDRLKVTRARDRSVDTETFTFLREHVKDTRHRLERLRSATKHSINALRTQMEHASTWITELQLLASEHWQGGLVVAAIQTMAHTLQQVEKTRIRALVSGLERLLEAVDRLLANYDRARQDKLRLYWARSAAEEAAGKVAHYRQKINHGKPKQEAKMAAALRELMIAQRCFHMLNNSLPNHFVQLEADTAVGILSAATAYMQTNTDTLKKALLSLTDQTQPVIHLAEHLRRDAQGVHGGGDYAGGGAAAGQGSSRHASRNLATHERRRADESHARTLSASHSGSRTHTQSLSQVAPRSDSGRDMTGLGLTADGGSSSPCGSLLTTARSVRGGGGGEGVGGGGSTQPLHSPKTSITPPRPPLLEPTHSLSSSLPPSHSLTNSLAPSYASFPQRTLPFGYPVHGRESNAGRSPGDGHALGSGGREMRLMLDALRDFRTWQSSGGVGAWEEHAHGAGWKVVEDGSRVMDVIGEREREGGKQAAPDELILTLAPSAVLVGIERATERQQESQVWLAPGNASAHVLSSVSALPSSSMTVSLSSATPSVSLAQGPPRTHTRLHGVDMWGGGGERQKHLQDLVSEAPNWCENKPLARIKVSLPLSELRAQKHTMLGCLEKHELLGSLEAVCVGGDKGMDKGMGLDASMGPMPRAPALRSTSTETATASEGRLREGGVSTSSSLAHVRASSPSTRGEVASGARGEIDVEGRGHQASSGGSGMRGDGQEEHVERKTDSHTAGALLASPGLRVGEAAYAAREVTAGDSKYNELGGQVRASVVEEGETKERQRWIIDTLCSMVEKRGLTKEGVFRASGNRHMLSIGRQELESASREQPCSTSLLSSLSSCDPDDIAALLKLYLREIDEPVLPIALNHALLKLASAAQHGSRRVDEELADLCETIPEWNRWVLQRLVRTLALASAAPRVKMDVASLAISMAPNLSRVASSGSLTVSVGVLMRHAAAVATLLEALIHRERASLQAHANTRSPPAAQHYDTRRTGRNDVVTGAGAGQTERVATISQSKMERGQGAGIHDMRDVASVLGADANQGRGLVCSAEWGSGDEESVMEQHDGAQGDKERDGTGEDSPEAKTQYGDVIAGSGTRQLASKLQPAVTNANPSSPILHTRAHTPPVQRILHSPATQATQSPFIPFIFHSSSQPESRSQSHSISPLPVAEPLAVWTEFGERAPAAQERRDEISPVSPPLISLSPVLSSVAPSSNPPVLSAGQELLYAGGRGAPHAALHGNPFASVLDGSTDKKTGSPMPDVRGGYDVAVDTDASGHALLAKTEGIVLGDGVSDVAGIKSASSVTSPSSAAMIMSLAAGAGASLNPFGTSTNPFETI